MNALLLLAALAASAAPAPKPEPTLTLEARAFKPGEAVLLVVDGADPKAPPESSIDGRDLPFFQGASTGTWLAIAGFDLDRSTGALTISVRAKAPGGKPVRLERTIDLELAKFDEVELKVDQKYVTPSKSDAERAEAEAQKLFKLFSTGEKKRLFEGKFDSPIPGAATARFGERRVFNGERRAPHSGMDLRAKSGVPVKAPAAGRVVLADPLFYAGNTVVIDHGLGITTQYAHLSRMSVKPGDMVKKGQVIGKVGATGRVTGPHLHWALKLRNARIDPYSLAHLDLDARLIAKPASPLKRSALCGAEGLPPAPKWGRASGGLRARARAARSSYAPGEAVSLLVEIQNAGKKPAFVDFVRDAAVRPLVLGVGEPARPFEALLSSATASRPLTEQVKIPKNAILCFEQPWSAEGPLLAGAATGYWLVYTTEHLYPSTSTVRAGVWRGKLVIPPAAVAVSSGAAAPDANR